MVYDKGALVVSVAGDITWDTAPQLREGISTLLQKGHRSVVLNMASVGFVDSSGLATLIQLRKRVSAVHGQMILINTCQAVSRAIIQAQLVDYLPFIAKGSIQHTSPAPLPMDEQPIVARSIGLPAHPSGMAQARNDVAQMFISLGLDRNVTYDLVLALGEALGNAFDHGGGCAHDGDVTVAVNVYRDRVVMEVTDCGCGCEVLSSDELPEPTETRGRGIRLMLMLTDSVEIHPRRRGEGTCVRLVKMLDVRPHMG